jgi:hypothetical protein
MILREEDRQMIMGALDTFATALASHDHTWTEGERTIYEQACAAVGHQPIGDFVDSNEDDQAGEEWKGQ